MNYHVLESSSCLQAIISKCHTAAVLSGARLWGIRTCLHVLWLYVIIQLAYVYAWYVPILSFVTSTMFMYREVPHLEINVWCQCYMTTSERSGSLYRKREVSLNAATAALNQSLFLLRSEPRTLQKAFIDVKDKDDRSSPDWFRHEFDLPLGFIGSSPCCHVLGWSDRLNVGGTWETDE